jgi:hypothetical protein
MRVDYSTFGIPSWKKTERQTTDLDLHTDVVEIGSQTPTRLPCFPYPEHSNCMLEAPILYSVPRIHREFRILDTSRRGAEPTMDPADAESNEEVERYSKYPTLALVSEV